MLQDQRKDRQWQRVGRQLLRCSVVDAVGVAVNTTALYAFHGLARLPLVPASVLSVELAIVHSFLWNDRWTFQGVGQDSRWLRFLKFNGVSLGGLGIATGTLWILVDGVGVYYLAANLVGIVLATLWNFGVNVVWTWGHSPPTSLEQDGTIDLERAA